MKIGRKYISAIMMGAALLAVPSCTDTWNEHYASEDANSATKSLWQTIQEREDLTNFTQLMKTAKFYRDENHPAYTVNEAGEKVSYTYDLILNSNNAVTLWAVPDDALTEEEWNVLKDMAENDGYNFQQQFIGNHMALARRPMTEISAEPEKIRLVNGKLAVLDYQNSTFAGVAIARDEEGRKLMNIGTRNGLLHIIEDQTDFDYNIYEYIKFSNKSYLTKINEYFVKRDTTYFVSGSSIEGLPDENGNPTYVDSVYFQDNMNFSRGSYNPTDADGSDAWMNNMKMMNAKINVEDSAYIVILPKDEAWEKAVANLKPYYNYVEKYPRMDKLKNESGSKSTRSMEIKGARKTYSTSDGSAYETTDSLRDVNITMDIVSPIAFNLNVQPQVAKGVKWTMEEFIVKERYNECDYLLNTQGDTIFNIHKDKQGRGCDFNQLFAGAKVKMSNGYVIEASDWNIPEDIWRRNIDVECTYNDYYKSSATLYAVNTLNNTTAADWIDQYGRLSQQNYMRCYGTGTSTKPEIAFPLEGSKQGAAYAMSGKYDIKVVMVPRWYEDSQDTPEFYRILNEKGEVYDPEDPEQTPADTLYLQNLLTFTLNYWSQGMISKDNYKFTNQDKLVADNIHYNGEKVDTITIFTDVEFPVSYKNLKNTYPVLRIQSKDYAAKYCPYDKTLHSTYFNIDRIILERKN